MGAGVSDLKHVKDSQELAKLVSEELIAPNDPFWNELLGFSLKNRPSKTDEKALQKDVEDLLSAFIVNNPKTGNFASLIRIFSLKASDLKTSLSHKCSEPAGETLRAALVVRQLCQLLVSAPDEAALVHQCRALPLPAGVPAPAAADPLQLLIVALLELIVGLPLLESTYYIHLEALNTLLILLGSQMYTAKEAWELPVYRTLMTGRCAEHADTLVKTLLKRVSARDDAPSWTGGGSGGGGGGSGGSSLALGLAGGLWNALTLGYGSLSSSLEEEDDNWPPVAKQSLHVLIVLGNHCTNDEQLPNPYRRTMFEMANFHDPAEPELVDRPHSFRLDFGRLLNALCALPPAEPATLLLYLLMHKSAAFRTYALSRTDVDTVVMPTLMTLYRASESSSSHLYMSLIVLLILTEDELFNRSVHDTMLKSVAWFTERQVTDISVGSLIVLVLVRTIQYNMTSTRDKYLHTNCLAALANMSAEFRRLHPLVCQRLVALFEQLARRHGRQLQRLQDAQQPSGADLQDVTVLEEVLKMLLEIINSCLSAQMTHNPNLVYALLYKRSTFQECMVHTSFHDIARNIDSVLLYFHAKVNALPKEPSVKDVLAVIGEGAKMFPAERLKKFPELKFKYVEEREPEAFFIPYVWSAVFAGSELYWAPDNVCLFSPESVGC